MKTFSLIPLSICMALLVSCSKDDGIGEQPSIPSDPTVTPDGSAGPSLATVKYSDFLKWDDCDKLNFDTWRVVSQDTKTPWSQTANGPFWSTTLPTIITIGVESPSIATDSLRFKAGNVMVHHFSGLRSGSTTTMPMSMDCTTLISGAKTYLTEASTGDPFGYEHCELQQFNDTTATLIFVSRLFFNQKNSDLIYYRHVETLELELDTRRLDILK